MEQLEQLEELEEYRQEKDRAYYARNRARVRARQKAYYERNRDRIKQRAKAHAEKNPQARAVINRRARLKSYGLTEAEYAQMLLDQGGVCAACGQPEAQVASLPVDHNHETGDVRGLLCTPCNSAAGMLGDDPERLLALAAYLDARR